MAQIREELILYDRFTNTFTSYIQQAKKAAGATKSVEQSVDQMASSQRRAAAAAGSLTGALSGIVGIYTVIQGAKWALNMSDQLASTTARLDMMNDGLQTTEELQEMIYQSAQRSRGLYTDTAAFVAKLGTLAGNAFDSNAEIVAFAEQINKQMAISGTTSTEASAAMLQLTQGLSSGVLRGEELNSVLEQTPMIAQTIANYMGVTTGEMRELASEGKVTADVVKNAMFAAAEETNAAFDEMPKTWGQVWNEIQNVAVKALNPLFDALNKLANSDFAKTAINGIRFALTGLGTAVNFVADNIDILGPILATAAAAWIAYKAVIIAVKVQQWLLNAAMAANPIGLVIALVVALVAVFIWLCDTFEGFRNFVVEMWGAQAEAALYFYNGVIVPVTNAIIPLLNQVGAAFQSLAEIIVEAFSAAGKFFAENMDFMLGSLRSALEMYNTIASAFGWKTVNVDYALSVEGIEEARQKALETIRGWGVEGGIQQLERWDEQKYLQNLEAFKDWGKDFRVSDFISETLGSAIDTVSGSAGAISAEAIPYDELASQISSIGDSVSGIEKAVNMSEEDLKSLVDVAERRYVNQVNLTAQTPVITVNGANTGRTAADRQALANAIRDMLIEQSAAGSVRSTAVPVMG